MVISVQDGNLCVILAIMACTGDHGPRDASLGGGCWRAAACPSRIQRGQSGNTPGCASVRLAWQARTSIMELPAALHGVGWHGQAVCSLVLREIPWLAVIRFESQWERCSCAGGQTGCGSWSVKPFLFLGCLIPPPPFSSSLWCALLQCHHVAAGTQETIKAACCCQKLKAQWHNSS